jgi:hypothetical protein
LKSKDFQAITRLAWAQEAPGLNPGAPTKPIIRIFFRLQKASFTRNFNVEIRQAGGLNSQVVLLQRVRRTTNIEKHADAGVLLTRY